MKRWFIITMILLIATMLSASATELFFSEYVEGSSNNKAIEIFNGTGQAVDLTAYTVKLATNGNNWNNNITLSGSLANNDVFVIANSQANAAILALSDVTSTVTMFNGNDAIGLFKDGVLIDAIGIQGVDPGATGWPVAGTAGAMVNHTLIRKAAVFSPTTDWALSAGTTADDSQWEIQAIDYITNLGTHTFTGGTTDPFVTVTAPNGSEQWQQGTSHAITWISGNFTGNVKIELLTGETPSVLVANTENDGSWDWAIPASFAIAANYKVKITAVAGSPTDTSNNTFSVVAPPTVVDVQTIAALRALPADNTTIYRLTGEALVSFTRTSRNQKYIQDATGGLLVDDPNSVITTTYNIGDGITNLTGKTTPYHEVIEFIPTVDPGAASSTGNVIVPATVTLSEFTTNYANYESKLVKVTGVTFAPGQTEGVFVAATNYNISDASGSGIFRTSFAETNIIGTTIPTTARDIIAIAARYDATMQLASRSLADITDPTGAPSITVSSPNGGESWEPGTTHAITWASSNITGNVKIELLLETTTVVLIADTENDGTWDWTISEDQPEAAGYSVKVSALTGNVSDASNATFSIMAPQVTSVATIAALRASNADNTTIYRLTGEAVVSYLRSTRNQKYVQDATGGILIDDATGVLTGTFAVGNGLTNLTGKLTAYHELLEFVPTSPLSSPVTTGNPVTATTVTIADLNANIGLYESRLVELENVHFSDTGSFAAATNYTLTDGNNNTVVFRTNFSDADYIGTAIPTQLLNVYAIATRYDATVQLTSRSQNDLDGVANNDPTTPAAMNQLTGNYPNPFNPQTTIRYNLKNSSPVTVEIYNVLGQKVRTLVSESKAAGSHSVAWDGTDDSHRKVSSGIYFYKMKAGTYSDTKKMVLMK